MRKIVTKRLAPVSLAFVLGLGMSAAGCKGKDGPDTPGGQNGQQLPDEVKKQKKKEADAEFMKVVAEYQAAKEGKDRLPEAKCKSISGKFHKLYQDYGELMLAAEFNVAAIAEECGDVKAAEKIYGELAKKKYQLAYNNLGVIYWKRGDYNKALEQFNKAIEADKVKAFAARNNVAAAMRDRYADKVDIKDFEEAQRQIQNVLAVDSSNKAAYENLARLYYDRGRLADKSYLLLANLVTTQAITVLKEEGQESADIYNLKGLLLMQEDNQVEALKAFKKAAEVDKKHVDANLNIAFISIRFRDYSTAEASLEIALKDPNVQKNIEAVIAMGVSKRGMKKYKDAEEWYTKASKVDAKDPRPWYNMAILYQEHMTTQDNVDGEAIGKLYKQADKHYEKFLGMAEPILAKAKKDEKPEWERLVQDAKDRRLIIEDYFITMAKMAELEKQAAELAKQEEAARKAEIERLLKMEEEAKKAAAAGGGDAAAAGGGDAGGEKKEGE